MSSRLAKLARLVRHRDLTAFYLNRTLWHFGMPGVRLQPASLDSIFPEIRRVVCDVHLLYPLERITGRSIEVDELVILLMIERFTKARRILEVGTLFGNTTLNLAANTDGCVTTIDLPREALADGDAHGAQFREHNLSFRIRQVYGDSASLDWSTLGGPFDLIFIDGCHTSQHVHSDSLNALDHLRLGGTIVWHNYSYGTVAKVLDSYAESGFPLHWISGTDFAVAIVADPSATRQTLSVTARMYA